MMTDVTVFQDSGSGRLLMEHSEWVSLFLDFILEISYRSWRTGPAEQEC